MKLNERDLIAIIKAHRDDSLGVEDGELTNERARALDHYHGRPYGNEVEGRSAVVSRDLSEAVDWALPAIMRVFVQSGNLGEFDPVGPEDEELARQESDYVNQVLMKDNPGFMVLHDAIKDTLLLKNGYVKHFWDETEEISEESYTGLSLEQVVRLLQELEDSGAEVEIVGQDSREVPIPGMPQPANPAMAIMVPQTLELFDLKLKIKRYCGKLCLMAVPAEEVRVSKKCRGSLQESPFTEHVTRKTRSELIEMGMPRDFVDSLASENERDRNDDQRYARDSVEDESDELGTAIIDRSMDEIEFCEAYIKVDADGDGVAELRKIVTVADKIPPGEQWNEPIEAVPMTGFVMKRVPHRHVGESLDDELSDLQEIKTTLHRQMLDNLYHVNNYRVAINERVNHRDLMTNTPGGVVRNKGIDPVGGNIMPMPTTPVIDKILPAIDYWDKTKEVRTGIRPGSDMDPDMLQQVTKGAFMEHLNRASQKIEMITRMLAETGVKEMFLQAHGILVRHQDQPRMVQMRGKWIEVNPQEWKKRTDLTVRVGLGTGNEEEKRQKLIMLAQFQDRLGPHGMVGPNQLYSLFEDLVKALGFDIPEKYAMTPNSPEFKQMQQQRAQQPNPEMAKVQATAQAKQAELQMQAEVDRNHQAVEAQQQQARMQMEMQLERFKAQMEMQLERERMAMRQELDMVIARLNASTDLTKAQITAQTTMTAQQDAASDGAVSN